MKRKLSGILALVTVLTFSSTALAQDETNLLSDLVSNITANIGQIAAVIWLILFTAWGGFRWFY